VSQCPHENPLGSDHRRLPDRAVHGLGRDQWTAWQLGFQPQLGCPGSAGGLAGLYPPAFFWWWFFYDAYAPSIFVDGAYIAASGGFLSIAVAIAMSVWRAREAKNVETYGSARWARPDEVKARAARPDGVVLGKLDRDYLRHDGPSMSVLRAHAVRQGRGPGRALALTWPGSAIVHDIKGENWTLTAGFRARHGRVLLFDPTNAKSAAYNPLLEVRRGEWEVRDVQNIADVLVDPEGSLEKRNHWEKPRTRCWSARSCMSSMPRPTRRWPASPPSCPTRSADRVDAGGDDEDRPSRRGRRIPSSHRPRASCSTSPTTSDRACCRPPCPSSASIAIPSSPRSRAAATGASPIW
jgi:type IV secretory pathway TraG/TraD family ATPase VirD4